MPASPASSQSPEFRDRIGDEISQWEKEGLVRPEQAQALRARYGLLPGETVRTLHQSRLVHLLSVLGVILVGVGVILLVGANWEQIPRWVRLGLLIGATAAAYGGGYRLAYTSKTYPKVGMALLLLGSLLWGASIFLVWQTFHLSGSGPGQGDEAKALLYWFVGVLPLAYLLRSPLHLSLSLVVGTIWLMLVLGRWGEERPQAMVAVLLAVGVLLYALGRLHESRALGTLEIPYRWVGLLYVFTALYAFSYRAFWYSPWHHAAPSMLVPGIVLAVAGATVFVLLLREGNRSRTALAEAAALLGLVALAWLVAGAFDMLALPGYPFEHPTAQALLIAAPFNLLLLVAEVGLVALGWARRLPGLMNFGLFVFFLQVVTRYFDLLGGMLQGGLMFIGAGVLLVALGVALERSRRSLLRSMERRA
jgi:uncharacterized membrane protein